MFWFQDPFVFFWLFGALVTPHWSTSAPKGTALGTNALKTIRTPGPAPRECGNDGREQGRHPIIDIFVGYIHSPMQGRDS